MRSKGGGAARRSAAETGRRWASDPRPIAVPSRALWTLRVRRYRRLPEPLHGEGADMALAGDKDAFDVVFIDHIRGRRSGRMDDAGVVRRHIIDVEEESNHGRLISFVLQIIDPGDVAGNFAEI